MTPREQLVEALAVERHTPLPRPYIYQRTEEETFEIMVYDPITCAQHQRDLAAAIGVGIDTWEQAEVS
jgi:hypothetical protein